LSRSPHDEFLELCAVSTAGQLSKEEEKRLREHLAVCGSCREVMKQYEAVAGEAVLALKHSQNAESSPEWSQEQAEAALFERLKMEDEFCGVGRVADESPASQPSDSLPFAATQASWRNVGILCAAGLLLLIALGISAYRVGTRHGTREVSVSNPRQPFDQGDMQQQLSDIGHEREVLRSQIAERDREIAALRHQLGQQVNEVSRMKLTQHQLATDLESGQASTQDLSQQRTELNQKLEKAEAKNQELQGRLGLLEHQSSQDKQRAGSLEAQIVDLTRALREREATIDQQQELLAHDRDIRDLMGARDLYVAEVYDVERTGETKKPYGRVFYTKGKSLIFYAYDLDQQAGVKNASSFQAWGRRGPDWQKALNLGVFYIDNASKKRWVLRFDDPKALAQIDAVFVTVEPNGGSHKPSSNKPLLFAYLHIDPNHP
jgi:Putative zinc-finger